MKEVQLIIVWQSLVQWWLLHYCGLCGTVIWSTLQCITMHCSEGLFSRIYCSTYWYRTLQCSVIYSSSHKSGNDCQIRANLGLGPPPTFYWYYYSSHLCTALHCTKMHFYLLHWTAMHCTALPCPTLYCNALSTFSLGTKHSHRLYCLDQFWKPRLHLMWGFISLLDDSLMTRWWLTDDSSVSHWWLIVYSLVTNWVL